MKKTVIYLTLISTSSICFATTLQSLDKTKFKKEFINKTFISIGTDNLNGRTIENTFSMFLDDKGHIWGKMSHKPENEPQSDQGIYTVAEDGTFYITWQHWDGAKKLCGRIFNTENAYISVDCDNIFHTAFMKEAVKSGNQLK